jgi:hypothetical protein
MLIICSSNKKEAADSRFLRAGVARLYLEVFALERMVAVLQSSTFERCDEEGRRLIGASVNRALRRLQGADKPQISTDQKTYEVLIETFSRVFRPGHVADLERIVMRLQARPNLQKALWQSHLVNSTGGINIGELIMGNKQETHGGVHISGGAVHTEGGDIFGGDKNVMIRQKIDHALQPVAAEIEKAPPERKAAASQKLDQIKSEVAKGKSADDGVVAKLVEGLVGLVPSAVTAIVSAFGTPILGGIAGPVTKYVLDKFQAKPSETPLGEV